MIKRIQAHIKKKRVQARAIQTQQVISASSQDIARKLASYTPNGNTHKANFLGPRIHKSELEGAV